MQTGVIIRRKAGTFIPNAYLEKALAENPKGWGAAIVTDGVLQVNKGDTISLEDMQDTMKTFEKSDITFYLCNSATALNEDDMSPYTLLSDGEQPSLVAFIEGNFPGRAKKESSHPPEFFVVQETLIPKFQSLGEMTDGDLTKIMKQLEKPHFKKELLLDAVSRGVITLVASNGTSLTFAQSDTAVEYQWGWVSNSYGYSTGEAPKEKKGIFARSTVREKAPVAASPAIAEAVKPPPTDTTVVKNYTTKMEKPPGHLSRKDKGNWYKQKIGYKPDGWERGVAIEVYLDPNGKVLSLSQVKELGLKAVGLPKLHNGKDTDTKHIPHPQQVSNQPAVNVEALPLMSPATREKVKSMMNDPAVKKLIAENADIVMDPSKVKDIEAKFADFKTQVGAKSIDEFLMWSFPMIREFNRSNPDGLENLYWTVRNMLASMKAKEHKRTASEQQEEEVNPPVVEKRGIFARKAG